MEESEKKAFMKKLRGMSDANLDGYVKNLYRCWLSAEGKFHMPDEYPLGMWDKNRLSRLSFVSRDKEKYEVAKEVLLSRKPKSNEPPPKKRIIQIPENLERYDCREHSGDSTSLSDDSIASK